MLFGGGVGVGLIVLIFIVNVLTVSPESRKSVLELWFAGLGSFGAFGAVVVALFSDTIKRFVNRPDLFLEVSNCEPSCTVENVESGSAKKEEFIEICCKVENRGGLTAEKSRVVCDCVYTKGADKKFSVSNTHKFRPQSFIWIGSGSKCYEIDISNSFWEYIKIAEIRTKCSELGKAPDGTTTEHHNKTPYLVVCLPSKSLKNQYIQLDDDLSVILPLRLVCAGASSKTYFVQINWEGKSIADYEKDVEKLAVIDVTDDMKKLARQKN